MKRVKIITIHFGENHGSALQAYALSRYINNHDCLCEIIDYVPKRYGMWNRYYKSYIKHYSFPLVLAYYPIYVFKTLPGRLIFQRFLKKYIPMTRRYKTNKDLFEHPPKGDIYIAGSDQIWNTDYNGKDERAYFFEYITESKKRVVSYAASFGKDNNLSSEEYEFFKKHLSRFDQISVREDAGLEILKKCGYLGELVCDPTFLLKKKEWDVLTVSMPIKDRYVLVYVMDSIHDVLIENAYRIAKHIHAKVYVIDFTPIDDKRIDKCFYRCTPNMFLTLISKSEFVVTNSFHGTVFSTIFEKPFLTIRKKQYNSRLDTLLKYSEQITRMFEPDHIVNQEEICNLIDKKKNDNASESLNNWIELSKSLLNNYLR